jgi:hypothetical protein
MSGHVPDPSHHAHWMAAFVALVLLLVALSIVLGRLAAPAASVDDGTAAAVAHHVPVR